MRSRSDDFDAAGTIERALRLGLVGFGEAGADDRLQRRVDRFAVVATFGRGGRNFQQIHHPSVSAQTQRAWDAGVVEPS